MNQLNDMTDEEFVPFLNNLGVETFKKSFEWMLNDPDFAGVLRWLYNNLDENNALSAREECRYIELNKKGQLLSIDELQTAIHTIQEEYPNICLPGDQEAMEDLKLDINMQKQRLNVLEKQELVVKDLLKHNETSKESLTVELTKLGSAHQQCEEDVKSAAEQCIQLAEELDSALDDVIDTVDDTFEAYQSFQDDKENAKRFFTFGPIDTYRQSQALFKSHFDLYTAKKFAKKQHDMSDDELKSALIAAKDMEERLTDAILAYIESKAELSGVHAKLAFVTNYTDLYPSQASSLMQVQSDLELLEQEEFILNQQMQSGVRDLVDARTSLTLEVAARSALADREQVLSDVCELVSVSQQAWRLDRAVYCALRHELTTLERFLHFAADLKVYLTSQQEAVSSRIDSMHAICAEQEDCERRLRSANILLQSFHTILGGQPTNDSLQLVKSYSDLHNILKELREEADEGFGRREEGLAAFKNSAKPLKEYIFDGCTRQPNCWDITLASLTHSLKQEMNKIDKKVLDASNMFSSVKNGDKQHLRKLWQWFLADPNKLMAALKGA